MTEKIEGGQEKALTPATSPDQPPSPPPAVSGRTDVPEASSAASPAEQAEAATATATAAAHPRAFDAVGAVARAPLDPVEPSPQLGRPGPPVLAGAAIAGLVLIAAPFAVSASTQSSTLETVPLTSGSLIAGTSDREGSENAAGSSASGSNGTAEAATTGSVNDTASDGSGGYVPEVREEPSGSAATPDPGTGETGEEERSDPAPDGTSGETTTTSGSGDQSGGSGDAPEARISDEDAPGIIGSLPEVGSRSSTGEDDGDGERSSRPDDTEDSGGSGDTGSAGSTERSTDSGQQSADGDGASTLAQAASASEREERSAAEGETSQGEEGTAEGGEQSGQRTPENEENADVPPPAPAASEEPAESQPSTQASPAAWSFSEIVGPGCASDEAASYGRAGAWHEGDGTASWAVREGADPQEDCTAAYDAIPVSGDPERGDGQYAYWTFTPGRPGVACDIYVHVPDDESPLWVAEREAKYQVFPGPTSEGEAIGVFGVEQSAVRGGWVQVTGFTSPAESFTVQLTNIGEDTVGGEGEARSHVAASVVRATCS
ncbi:hypothetical protein ACQEU5_04300 [Marinactinospora thermotolerans]|uniref:Uncharacterized protein n=1 Tax=Marinactinospora thermotolerans DSM 45154 TaxID=1122192 RepID=A0A1T4QCF9_9ACTN|nr:hypothetical protein [Marinactinospora thermotolerans]SKA01419.1 hypothetical protein SAMN02745673_02153 [Marinactinospora thermotolerans DSM 45154]